MDSEIYRNLRKDEIKILKKLLEKPFPGREALLKQLELSKVREIDSDGSLQFQIPRNVERARVSSSIPVEGRYTDSSENNVQVLLHIKNGLLNELEFFKFELKDVGKLRDVDELKVWVKDE